MQHTKSMITKFENKGKKTLTYVIHTVEILDRKYERPIDLKPKLLLELPQLLQDFIPTELWPRQHEPSKTCAMQNLSEDKQMKESKQNSVNR